MEEAELIARCKAADPAAQVELFRLYSERVGRFVLRLAGPGGDAEDLTQETFIRAYGGIANFRGESAVSTWLCAIAVRVVRESRRREMRRRSIMDGYAGLGGLAEWLFGASRGQRREEADRRGDEARLVYEVLDRLPEIFRGVLILHEMEDMSGPEIAAVLGVSENTVWTRLHRARKMFRQVAKGLGYGPG